MSGWSGRAVEELQAEWRAELARMQQRYMERPRPDLGGLQNAASSGTWGDITRATNPFWTSRVVSASTAPSRSEWFRQWYTGEWPEPLHPALVVEDGL